MSFTKEETEIFKNIKTELETSQKPLFFFHDDPDGICSFLQFYKHVGKGYGVIVKSKPTLNDMFSQKVLSYKPDKVFVLDLAVVEQRFIDTCIDNGIKLIIIDHHQLSDYSKATIYYNPKQFRKDDAMCVTSLCFFMLEKPERFLWLAACGTVSDWQLPVFFDDLKKKYPELLKEYRIQDVMDSGNKDNNYFRFSDDDLKNFETLLKKADAHYKPDSIEHVLFNTKIGLLGRILSLSVNGKMTQVKQTIKALTEIDDHEELLEQATAQGRFIYRRFRAYFVKYIKLLTDAISKAENETSNVLVYTYASYDSFSGELSNEIYYYYWEKFVIVARLKSGVFRTSMRYHDNALAIFNKAKKDLAINGGGHKNACGANISQKDFEEFVNRVKKEVD